MLLTLMIGLKGLYMCTFDRTRFVSEMVLLSSFIHFKKLAQPLLSPSEFIKNLLGNPKC